MRKVSRTSIASAAFVVAVVGVGVVLFARGDSEPRTSARVSNATNASAIPVPDSYAIRSHFAGASLENGDFFLFGGWVQHGSRVTSPSNGVRYDSSRQQWSGVAGPSATKKVGPAIAAAIGRDEILLSGRICSDEQLDPEAAEPSCAPGSLGVFLYDVSRSSWKDLGTPTGAVPSVPVALGGDRATIVLVTLSKELFDREVVWQYDRSADAWQRVTDPKRPPQQVCIAGALVVGMSYSDTVDGKVVDPPIAGEAVPINGATDISVATLRLESGQWSDDVPLTGASSMVTPGLLCSPETIAVTLGPSFARDPKVVLIDTATQTIVRVAQDGGGPDLPGIATSATLAGSKLIVFGSEAGTVWQLPAGPAGVQPRWERAETRPAGFSVHEVFSNGRAPFIVSSRGDKVVLSAL